MLTVTEWSVDAVVVATVVGLDVVCVDAVSAAEAGVAVVVTVLAVGVEDRSDSGALHPARTTRLARQKARATRRRDTSLTPMGHKKTMPVSSVCLPIQPKR